MAKTFTSNKRLMIQAILGLLLGRVWIFSINPFAIAYFGLALAERKRRGILLAGILLGMASMISGTEYVKYILIMLLMWFMDYLLKKYSDVCWSTLLIGIGSGAIVMIFGITNALLSVDTMNLLIVAVLEGVSVVALTNIFQWGIRFLLYENMDKILENEELISLLSLVTLALYGMPHAWEGLFSISATIMYLVVLYVGYRYGASAGAIAGDAGGILASLMGSGAVAIGLYCLLGIGVGMFRQAGRILSCLVFVAMGFALAYTFSQEIVGIVELRGIVSAVIIFLAVPGKMVEKIQVDFESQEENPFAREDIKTIANYKMEDFVETLYSSALPVGVELEVEPDQKRRQLQDGDIIVMVTDGIIDAFPGEEKEFYIENILVNMGSSNPSDIANRILMQALERGERMASDDMSVLVAGIWEKTGRV